MRSDQEMVAYALEVEPALLPYLPELLADLEELGSDAELITSVIDSFALANTTQVVDLGCGKGAVAVEIAEELGFSVTGIELFEPFIASCNELAQERNVANLCTFHYGNVIEMASVVGQFDIAIFSALGDVIGAPDETIAVVRDYVKPGGLIVVSDLYLAEGGSNDFPGFERYLNHTDTIALLTAHGDALVKELSNIEDDEEAEDESDDEAQLIRVRADALALQHPQLKQALLRFASDQAQENQFVDENFVDAIWVLRKS